MLTATRVQAKLYHERCACTHTLMHAHTLTHSHECTHTHMHTHMNAHTHTHTHTHMNACTHTHTVQTDRAEGQCWLQFPLDLINYSHHDFAIFWASGKHLSIVGEADVEHLIFVLGQLLTQHSRGFIQQTFIFRSPWRCSWMQRNWLRHLNKSRNKEINMSISLKKREKKERFYINEAESYYVHHSECLHCTDASLTYLLGDSGGVVNSLDFCPASLKSLGCFYFRCVLSSQWKAVTVNLRILHCQL